MIVMGTIMEHAIVDAEDVAAWLAYDRARPLRRRPTEVPQRRGVLLTACGVTLPTPPPATTEAERLCVLECRRSTPPAFTAAEVPTSSRAACHAGVERGSPAARVLSNGTGAEYCGRSRCGR
jgi:hypothetical protein